MEPGTLAEQMESCGVGGTAPIRILAVIPGDGSGSSMIFARRQVRSLSGLGVETRVFFVEKRLQPWQVARAARKLRSVVREFRPDIVHAHYGTVTSFLCACVTRRPLVITFRGSDLNRHGSVSSVRYLVAFALSQLSTLRARRVICVSPQLRDRLWWAGEIAAVLPSGVDLGLFQPQSQNDARGVLGWEQPTPTVLFNGGYDPQAKGLPLVYEAVARTEAKIGPVRLVVLNGNVSPDRMPLYLNAADCLLLASPHEGSPNIVKEALACNLPVVAVDVGDVAERLAGVEPSAIVPRNPHGMASALAEILTRRGRSNGREKLAKCSEEYVAGELLRIYGEVIRARKPNSAAVPAVKSDLAGLI